MSGFFSVSLGNYSLPKMISLQFGVDVSLYIFALLIGLFIWVVLTYNRPFQSPFSKTLEPVNEENSKVDAFFIASFASLTMLLGSKLVWSHYHLMTLPVFLYLMRPQIESGYILKSQAFIKFCTFIAFAFTTQLFVEIFPGQQACGFIGLLLGLGWLLPAQTPGIIQFQMCRLERKVEGLIMGDQGFREAVARRLIFGGLEKVEHGLLGLVVG